MRVSNPAEPEMERSVQRPQKHQQLIQGQLQEATEASPPRQHVASALELVTHPVRSYKLLLGERLGEHPFVGRHLSSADLQDKVDLVDMSSEDSITIPGGGGQEKSVGPTVQ
uniref:Uncharacterized protein n=1 Tax=Photinus pyralis TaxID=7054 RepID=A0A1Y1KKV0_PHOPY